MSKWVSGKGFVEVRLYGFKGIRYVLLTSAWGPTGELTEERSSESDL